MASPSSSSKGAKPPPSFKFSLIPPLPSSLDKENQSKKRKAEHSSHRPTGSNTPSHIFASAATSVKALPIASSSSSSIIPKPPLPSRLLRHGETLEGVFGVHPQQPDNYRRSCQTLVQTPHDVALWKQVLELAKDIGPLATQVHWNSQDFLVRLYRRATSRIHLKNDDNDDIALQIWLQYASIQSYEDAKFTLHAVALFAQHKAVYYLTKAAIEMKQNNRPAAIQVLQVGIRRQAQPLDALERQLSELQPTGASSPYQPNPRVTAGIEDDAGTDNSNMSLTEETSDLNDESHDESVSQHTIDVSSSKGTEARGRDESVDKPNNKSEPSVVGPGNTERVHSETTAAARTTTRTVESVSTPLEAQPPNNSAFRFKPLSPRKPFQLVSLQHESQSATRRRPPLLPKSLAAAAALQSGSKLLGKPQRVDPNDTAFMEQESDSEPETEANDGNSNNNPVKPASSEPTKIVKMDLSYMWAWDPDKPRQPSRAVVKAGESNSPDDQTSGIVGVPADDSHNSTASTDSQGKEAAKCKKEKSRDDGATTEPPAKDSDIGLAASSQSVELGSPKRAAEVTAGLGDKAVAMAASANPDFLPLVSENNMIRVNKIPYAKLGVVGKGGSCKVYRALSRNCTVVAIKKVKLAGMDKKAVSAYANEIELLKRLRSNPAIIQMYDSEVDISRKAIFLVMELGEVDLNHVLQQQVQASKGAGDTSPRHLNMNFIRLAWQQMLSAVHSIHEARIVHGDLKPANFLLVRGAIKLIDFGIAKAIQSDDTTNIYRESQIGTLNYMSPEAVRGTDIGTGRNGMKVGRPSDIWSMGCILYQMVYGRTPFADLHMLHKIRAIADPNHVIQFPGNVDEGAVDAMKQCLRRNPEERPPIVGPGGLLTEQRFLISSARQPT